MNQFFFQAACLIDMKYLWKGHLQALWRNQEVSFHKQIVGNWPRKKWLDEPTTNRVNMFITAWFIIIIIIIE